MTYLTGVSGITQTTNLPQQIYSENNKLLVHVDEPIGAFGGIETVQLNPAVNVDFVYGLNAYDVTTSTTGSGTVSSSGSLAIASTSATINSSAVIQSLRPAVYYPGQGVCGRFTAIFTTGVTGSTQTAGLFSSNYTDGFGFGYSGSTFGIWYINNSSTSFVAQSAWNVDRCDGSNGVNNPSGLNLTQSNGNVYQIKYQYLGFGNVKFYVENPVSGAFILVHMIRYANANVVPIN